VRFLLGFDLLLLGLSRIILRLVLYLDHFTLVQRVVDHRWQHGHISITDVGIIGY
jgi:hypothetical protein